MENTGRPPSRARLRVEVLLVLGLSLGQSAAFAIVQLLEKAAAGPLAGQVTTLNRSRSESEYFDLTYQLLSIGFALVPVALVLFFISGDGVNPFRRLGFDFTRPVSDLASGVALFVVIGAGSLGLYAVGRAAGVTTQIEPSALNTWWWTIPVLILSAIRHGIVEEVIVVGYLMDRLPKIGWSMIAVVVASALLRGSYHLYQGIGPFVGNVIMGVIFALVYLKTRRVMPLVIAHALLDIGAFVGFALFGSAIGLG